MFASQCSQKVALTGRARARPGWLGRQVLQVEVLTQWVRWRSPPPPHYTGEQLARWHARPDEVTSSRTHWRDAEWDDLAGVELAIAPSRNPIGQPDADR